MVYYGGVTTTADRHRPWIAAYSARARHWKVGMEVKSHLAAITGLLADDFALIGNASEGIVRAITSLDWRPGDNAVVSALDFESGRFALAGLAGERSYKFHSPNSRLTSV
jgi:selenocysteine lyase/cysteine desulfurase